MNRKDFYRKISFVVMVGCVLAAVACAPQKEDVTGTEVLETERLETEVTEETEGVGGETAGEAWPEEVEPEYSVTEFEITEVKVDEDVLDEDEIIDLLEDIAYVGGAILEDGCCDCDECGEHECHHHCDEEDDECDCEEEEN